MALSLEDKVILHTQMAHTALEKAAAVIAHKENREKQAKALIPTLVQSMIDLSILDPADAQKAAAALSDPLGAVETFLRFNNKLAQRLTEGTIGMKASEIEGTPAIKQANAGPAPKPASAATVALWAKFGLPAPSCD